jgi:hypothetical protein
MEDNRIKDIDDFVRELMKVIGQKDSKGYQAELRKNVKVNDVIRYSVNLFHEGKNAGINFYVDTMFEEYQNGASLEEMADYMLEMESQQDFSLIECPEKVREWLSCDSVKSGNIVVRLVNREKNKHYLEDKCHLPFLDLEIVFYKVFGVDDNRMATVAVPQAVFEEWNISKQQLLSDTLVTMERMYPARLESLERIAQRVTGKSIGDVERIFVLTNYCYMGGAVTILYRNVLKDFARERGVKEILILPSSLHEVMLVPYVSGFMLKERMRNLLQEVNQTEVPMDEVLSDNIYIYNVETDQIQVCDETD